MFTMRNFLWLAAWWFAAMALSNSHSAQPAIAKVAYTAVVVRVSGQGTVTPDYTQRPLPIGSYIYPRVHPAPGNVFVGWTYGTNSCYGCNVFQVEPGLELQANFVPDPFKALQGEFNGFITDTNPAEHAHAGWFNLRLDARGRIGGRLLVGGFSQSIVDTWERSLLTTNGQATGWVYPVLFSSGDPWNGSFRILMEADIQVSFSGDLDRVGGVLSDSSYRAGVRLPPTWLAELHGERAAVHTRANPAAQAGTYTLIFPGGDGSTEPAGAGYATLKVETTGRLSVTGYLADGSLVACNTALTQDGRWPLFASLYRGRGAICGWMTFANQPDSDLNGTLTWTRPASPTTPTPGTNQLAAVGARYQRPLGAATALPFTNGLAVFSQAGRFTPVTNAFALGPNNRVTNAGTNRFTLTLAPATGAFQGTLLRSVLGKSIVFKGAVLQKQQAGYGFFIATNKQSALAALLPK